MCSRPASVATLAGMFSRPPTARLLAKVLVAALLPAAVALVLFGTLAHAVARRALEDELGQRLATAASGVAMQILPEQLAAIGLGDEQSNTYANLTRRIELARQRLGVRRVLLVARDLSGRGDTEGLVALGARAYELGADQPEIERAATGALAGSPLFGDTMAGPTSVVMPAWAAPNLQDSSWWRAARSTSLSWPLFVAGWWRAALCAWFSSPGWRGGFPAA